MEILEINQDALPKLTKAKYTDRIERSKDLQDFDFTTGRISIGQSFERIGWYA